MHQDLVAQAGAGGAAGINLSGMQADQVQLEADPNYTSSTLSNMSAQELKRLQRWAYFRFYSDPSRIRRLLRDAPFDPGFVFRGMRIARFVAGSLPGAGRLERVWRGVRGFSRGTAPLDGTPIDTGRFPSASA
jgi:hypothetical protein